MMSDWWEDHICQASVTSQRPRGKPGEFGPGVDRAIFVMARLWGNPVFTYGGTLSIPWECDDDE